MYAAACGAVMVAASAIPMVRIANRPNNIQGPSSRAGSVRDGLLSAAPSRTLPARTSGGSVSLRWAGGFTLILQKYDGSHASTVLVCSKMDVTILRNSNEPSVL